MRFALQLSFLCFSAKNQGKGHTACPLEPRVRGLLVAEAGDYGVVVTVLLGAVHAGVDGGHVAAAEDVVYAVVEAVLVIGQSGAVAGFGVGIGHEAAEQAVGMGELRVVEIAANDEVAGGLAAGALGNEAGLSGTL